MSHWCGNSHVVLHPDRRRRIGSREKAGSIAEERNAPLRLPQAATSGRLVQLPIACQLMARQFCRMPRNSDPVRPYWPQPDIRSSSWRNESPEPAFRKSLSPVREVGRLVSRSWRRKSSDLPERTRRMRRRNQRFSPRSPPSDGPSKAASRLDQIIQDGIQSEDSPRLSANAVAPAASRREEGPCSFPRNASRPSGSVRDFRRVKAPRTRKERGRRAPSPQDVCGRPVRAGR